MPPATPGIHHVTVIGSDPSQNRAFYTETLGMRLVKRSVNQDDTSVYHLFYGDYRGAPGTSMTFFPYVNARPGEIGTGQVSTTGFLIPRTSIEYWTGRLADHNIDFEGPFNRFEDTVIAFEDPDGTQLELVGRDDVPDGNPPEGPVPEEHAIRGFAGVTLLLQDANRTADLIESMGFTPAGTANNRQRFVAAGPLGKVVDIIEAPDRRHGRQGAGTVHHVAFQTTEDDQPAWQDFLSNRGLRPTQLIDRKWFKSVYVREHGGVLFEFATEEPGYTVDEPLESLGEQLVLPEWFEDQREQIEASLPELE